MCGHKVAARADGGGLITCNQHFLLLGVGGIGLVATLTREQADTLRLEMQQRPVTAAEICRRLGLLRKPLAVVGA